MEETIETEEICVLVMQFGSFDCEDDGEHNSASLVAISKTFVTLGDLFFAAVPVDTV